MSKYDFGLDQLVRLDNGPAETSFFHLDILGSTVSLSDVSGSRRQSIIYDAWGNERDRIGISTNKFTFTGHEKDEETGLIYAKARFYDPDVARFLSQDSYLGDVTNVPSLHRYAYANANPAKFIDLDGYQSRDLDGDAKPWRGFFFQEQRAHSEQLHKIDDLISDASARGEGLTWWESFKVSFIANAAGTLGELPGQIEEGLLDLLIPGGFGAWQGDAHADHWTPTRSEQIGAIENLKDPDLPAVIRVEQGLEAVVAHPRAMVEGLVAPGGQSSERLGQKLYVLGQAENLGDVGFITLDAGGDFVHAFGVFGSFFAPLSSKGIPNAPLTAELATEARTSSLRSVTSSGGAEGLVTWVDEGGNLRAGGSPGMRPDAYRYQSGSPGARSNYLTGRSQAPYLEFTDEAGNVVGAKFDGVRGAELVDRKLNPVFTPKAVDQATRQAAIARHYGLEVVWELPTTKAVDAANRFIQSNSINGITVRLAPR